ncbi:hypothetical protein ACFFJ7_03555 [Pseudochelatococcus lubricantis]|uniref:hypothetical protein n=1 Tax=Pseudochelatococcus lubricantis TaxID=1538102 RepID=UPI0035E7CFAB
MIMGSLREGMVQRLIDLGRIARFAERDHSEKRGNVVRPPLAGKPENRRIAASWVQRRAFR